METLAATLNSQVPNRSPREYYQDNQEKINEYNKEYYQDNQERINEKSSERFSCVCGGRYIKRNKGQHMATKKHQSYMADPSV
jgi:hypothetical protein